MELKDVSFTYESGETQNNLNHIDLTIQDGETILLCGKSGCGHTAQCHTLAMKQVKMHQFFNGMPQSMSKV